MNIASLIGLPDSSKVAVLKTALTTMDKTDGGLAFAVKSAQTLLTMTNVLDAICIYYDLIGNFNLQMPWLTELVNYLNTIPDIGTGLEVEAGNGVFAMALRHKSLGYKESIICTSSHDQDYTVRYPIVEKLPYNDALIKYADCNSLFFVCPSSYQPSEYWISNALQKFTGKYVIFLGDASSVVTFDGKSYLEDNFLELKKITSYFSLPGPLVRHDTLSVYVRRDKFATYQKFENAAIYDSWYTYCQIKKAGFAEQNRLRELELELRGRQINRDVFVCLMGAQNIVRQMQPDLIKANSPEWNLTVAHVQCNEFFCRVSDLLGYWKQFPKKNCDGLCKNLGYGNCRVVLAENLRRYMETRHSFSDSLIYSSDYDWQFDPPNNTLPEFIKFKDKSEEEMACIVSAETEANKAILAKIAEMPQKISAAEAEEKFWMKKYEYIITNEVKRKLIFSLYCNVWNTAQVQLAIMLEICTAYDKCKCEYCKTGFELLKSWQFEHSTGVIKTLAETKLAAVWWQNASQFVVLYPGICNVCNKPLCDFTSRVPQYANHEWC